MTSLFNFRIKDYGFEWGPVEVTRMIADNKIGVLIGADTSTHNVQMAVSPKGRSVRIWVDGVKWGPVDD